MELVERQRGIAARRFSALIRDIADTRRGHTDFFTDLGQLPPGGLKISYAFGHEFMRRNYGIT